MSSLRSLLVCLLVFVALSNTSPLNLKTLSLEERAKSSSKCRAVLPHGSANEKRQFEIDDTIDEIDSKLEQRDRSQHCGVVGASISATPTYEQDNMTMRQCANWCLCTLGKKNCHTFGFQDGGYGQGTCSAYSQHQGSLGVSSGTGGTNVVYYSHQCFQQSTPTKPNPPPMTVPQKRHEPTPVPQRVDLLEKLVTRALEGV